MVGKERKIYRMGPEGQDIPVERVDEMLIDGDRELEILGPQGWTKRADLRRIRREGRTIYYMRPDMERPDAEGHEDDVMELDTKVAKIRIHEDDNKHLRALLEKFNLTRDRKIALGSSDEKLDEINNVLSETHIENLEEDIGELTPGAVELLGEVIGEMLEEAGSTDAIGEASAQNRFLRRIYNLSLRGVGRQLETDTGISEETRGAYLVNRSLLFSDTLYDSEGLKRLADAYETGQNERIEKNMVRALFMRVAQVREEIEEALNKGESETEKIGETIRGTLGEAVEHVEGGARWLHAESLKHLRDQPEELVELFAEFWGKIDDIVDTEDIPDDVVTAFMRERELLTYLEAGEKMSPVNLAGLIETRKRAGIISNEGSDVLRNNLESVSNMFNVFT